MSAYYNEFDPYAAQWLRNLIAAGHIADGDVDQRSINDVSADDLRPYTQCHFFAGIGVWSHALRLAGWDDDRPVWTGSCPCQPFSSAGKQKGTEDERHLWPVWFDLIRACRPPVVFGEQVAAAVGHSWLDTVQTNLEAEGYATGAVVLGAHSVGAPHIRQRLWFVANNNKGLEGRIGVSERSSELVAWPRGSWKSGELADSTGIRFDKQRGGQTTEIQRECAERKGEYQEPTCSWELQGGSEGLGGIRRLADSMHAGRTERGTERGAESGDGSAAGSGSVSRLANTDVSNEHERPSGWEQQVRQFRSTRSNWSDADWLYCRDGKIRPVEPGTFPLADGVAARMGRLRAYGNAIVPQVAAEVIAAFMECRP